MYGQRKTKTEPRPATGGTAAGVSKAPSLAPRPRSKELGRSAAAAGEYKVLVDLPSPLSVTEAELDLLEREVLPFIGDILGAIR